jgi:DNA adenine methylase
LSDVSPVGATLKRHTNLSLGGAASAMYDNTRDYKRGVEASTLQQDFVRTSVSEVDVAMTPPLKWAGGKRWFVQRYRSLVPSDFNTYYEPFFGSGALYFCLQPAAAVLSDLNEELINFYSIIRDERDLFGRYFRAHARSHSYDYYYQVRGSSPRSPAARAARFLYLNRTCWNGLYRVNRDGAFNVPIGTKTEVMLESDNFASLANRLATAELVTADFEESIERAVSGDFVFVDPPYTVAHNKNGFIKYNEKIFSWNDQIRLSKVVKSAVGRGVKVLITNANHESVISLYSEYGPVVVSRAGVIAGNPESRKSFEEVVIKCY